MDLETHLLDNIVEATTPPYETDAAARSRRAAIVQMVQAYGPTDAMEGMIVCHCVMLQYLLVGAMRDANNTALDPALLGRARSAAISISRTLHQWTTKFENTRKRNEARAAEAREAASQAHPPAPRPANQGPPDAPAPGPRPSPAERLTIHPPTPNGRAAASANGSTAGAPARSPSPALAERRPAT